MNPITRMLQNATKNWKTSAAGILGFLIILCQQLLAAVNGGDFNVELTLGALVVALGLTQARDADKSSEDSGIKPPVWLLILIPTFMLYGCASAAPDAKFENPKAKLAMQIGEEASAFNLMVRALTTARKTGLLSAKQFVGTEEHVKTLNASIDRAWSLLGQDKIEDAKAELDYFKRLLEQLGLYLQRSDHVIPSPARSTTYRGGSADGNRSPPANEESRNHHGGGSEVNRSFTSAFQERRDDRVRSAA